MPHRAHVELPRFAGHRRNRISPFQAGLKVPSRSNLGGHFVSTTSQRLLLKPPSRSNPASPTKVHVLSQSGPAVLSQSPPSTATSRAPAASDQTSSTRVALHLPEAARVPG